jgi:hypothetical protein
MAPGSIRILLPYLLLVGASAPSHGAKILPQPPSAVESGTVDFRLLAGGGLYGPSLGIQARFRNGFELAYRHARWLAGHADEAGIYFTPVPDLASGLRTYFGTELLRADHPAYALGAIPTLSSPDSRPALLLVAGQEHRLGGRMALAYEAAGGARLTRRYAGPLPPLAFQGRVEMRCRLF